MIKGFQSSFLAIKSFFSGYNRNIEQAYATLTELPGGKFALDTSPRWLAVLNTGVNLPVGTHTDRVLNIPGHGLSRGQVFRFTSAGPLIGIEAQIFDVLDANNVLLATKLPSIPAGGESYTLLRPVTPNSDTSGNLQVTDAARSVVDSLDADLFVPTGANAIPASGSATGIQVVASLAAEVRWIQVVQDIGEFINMYSDVNCTQFLCHLPLTPDVRQDVVIPAGSEIYLRNAKNVPIDDANVSLLINFVG